MTAGRKGVMKTWKRGSWARTAAIGLAAGLVFLLAGDRAATQAPPNAGIDPLDVLNVQVKNNVLFIVDTSGSMKWPMDADAFPVGGDDPVSRIYQAKQAVKTVVNANKANMNFGLATYNILDTNKTLNRNQNLDGGSGINGDNLGRTDGPFMYVSADANANVYYQSYTCPFTGGSRKGYFCQIDNTFANYNGITSDAVFRSFGNPQGNPTTNTVAPANPYPAGCTPGVNCRFYLQSRLFRDGQSFTWNTTAAGVTTAVKLVGVPTAITCPLPPAGLTGNNPDDNGDGFGDQPRACIEFVDQVTGNVSRFFYTGAIYQFNSGENTCGGAASIATVAPCTGDNSQLVLDAMLPELPVIDETHLGNTANGADPLNVTANTSADYLAGRSTPVFNGATRIAGLRADQQTPLAGALDYVRTAATPVFPPRPAAVAGIQKNFVILVTDGDDTCASGGFLGLDQNATDAARAAQALFANTADPQHQAETMVIALGGDVDVGRSNKIAQAGSGGTVGAGAVASVTCPAGVTCNNAFTAQSSTELVASLNQALELVVSSGEFAATQSIAGTVFELVKPPADPADPKTRYNQRVNLLYQPTFELPNWGGHLNAFRNDGTFQPVPTTVNPNQDWDTGDSLFFQVSVALRDGTGAGGQNRFLFGELWNGPPASPNATIRDVSTARIKRRIFTSAGNGSFPRNNTQFVSGPGPGGTNVVALWPPNPGENPAGVGDIDPATGAVGFLDDALGIGIGSSPVMTFADLQTDLGACRTTADAGAGPLPAACDNIANPTLALNTARKEARQIILAFTAGAKVLTGTDNKPLRHTNGELLYRDRGWLLGDPTVGAPAIMTPPLKFTPQRHSAEWVLFRDGHRDASRLGRDQDLNEGSGLRNPDFDNPNPATATFLKPRKTVVFLPGNDMLHAVSAETSEELWGYVPFDQLFKLKLFISRGQVRTPHIYMVAAAIRLADVFVPGTYLDTFNNVTYGGHWRTVIYFGRGPGGKYYTALDVTAPGPYTRAPLATNPPWVMWNRGNPDTTDGKAGGPAVRAADSVAYTKMGQTWSVPAIGNVYQTPANPPEWRAFVGSGYGSNGIEGKTFYALDAVTGDIVQSFGLADETTGITPPNGVGPDSALVANAAGYNSFQLDPSNSTTNRGVDAMTRVYIPDLHGRVWKFNTTSGGLLAKPGPSQPFANAVALLKLPDDANTFVYAESGNDTRVVLPAGQHFKAFAWRDTTLDVFPASVTTPLLTAAPTGTAGFTLDLLQDTFDFRGTAQPGVALNTAGKGRVFYLGTRFNTAGANCLSSFDSIFFGVGAETGVAVYDFVSAGNIVASASDKSIIIQGQKMIGSQVVGGEVLLSESGALGAAPQPPPPNSMPTPGPPNPAQITPGALTLGSAVCR
jgi:hypothetical protein